MHYTNNVIIVEVKDRFSNGYFHGCPTRRADTSKTRRASVDGNVVENGGRTASGKHNNPCARVGVMMITGHSASPGLI